MAKSDNIELIKITAQTTAKETVNEFINNGLLKNKKHSAFQKTETLLYNYNNFKAAIEEKYNHIDYLRKYGLDNKSKSITSFSSNNHSSRDSDDIIDDKIKNIEQSISLTANLIEMIDRAVNKLKDDKYYDIIKFKYIEKMTNDEIAEHFDVDGTTISRNKSRMINILKIYLFSDDVIKELL